MRQFGELGFLFTIILVGVWSQSVDSTNVEVESFDLRNDDIDIVGNCTLEGLFDIINIKNASELKAKDFNKFLKKAGLMQGKAKKKLKKGVKKFVKEADADKSKAINLDEFEAEFEAMLDIDLTDIFNINLAEIIKKFIDALETLFNIMDKNKDKLIERKEWKKIEKKLGKLGVNKPYFFHIFQDLDFNGDYNLSLDEFQGFLNPVQARMDPKPLLGCASAAIEVIWLVLSIIVKAAF